MPAGEERKTLQALIDRLAEPNMAPRFPPHVTLVGLGPLKESRADVSAAAKELVETRIKEQVPVTLRKVGMQDKFFRSLYLEASPTDALVDAVAWSRRLYERFHGRPPEEAAPLIHLSLLYGDFPADKKELIVKKQLRRREFDLHFMAKSVELWDTAGLPGRWRRLASFPLKPRSVPEPWPEPDDALDR